MRATERASRFILGLSVTTATALGALAGASCTTGGDDPGNNTSPTPGGDGSLRSDGSAPGDGGIAFRDALAVISPDALPPNSFCALADSLVSTAQGPAIVAGGTGPTPDLAWLSVPVGFCAHAYADVPEVRQLRVAPNGDVFAASPSQPTTGGASGGMGTVVVLPDDNHDGLPEAVTTFLTGLARVQGMTFANGYFYFQNDVVIQRVPYVTGDRTPRGPRENVTTITAEQASEHWPKVFDFDRNGTFYVSNASTQGEACSPGAAARGAIYKVNAQGTPVLVAKGFRNPIAMRCEQDHDVCLVAELAKDGSGGFGGREKLVPVRQGDDWGFPCCASKNVPYGDIPMTPDCSHATAEGVSFTIGHTPFGIDFEPGIWPAPWTGRVFVTLHGDVGTWFGARVVGIPLDAVTGLPLPASELATSASPADNMLDFATGWDDGAKNGHGRPAAIAFAPDGRMFLGNDANGQIVWIAPLALTRPQATAQPDAGPDQ